MIDRLVHHAEVVALKGDSYRLKNRDIGRAKPSTNDDEPTGEGSTFNRRQGVRLQPPLTKIECFHRTLADGWAYARCSTSETERRQALNGWLRSYTTTDPTAPAATSHRSRA